MASVISKKNAARAVDRNKVERRCREAMRFYMTRIKEPLALILRAKREAVDASSEDLKSDIKALMASVTLA